MHTSAEKAEEEEKEEEAGTRLERRRLIVRGRLDNPPSSEAPGGPSDFCTLDKGDTDTLSLNTVKSVVQRLKTFSFNNVCLLSS